MTGGGSAPARTPGFGDDAEPDGDPSAEFSGFESARGVASLGERGSEASLGFRREPTPEHPPKGSYRGEEQGFDDVVGNFGEEGLVTLHIYSPPLRLMNTYAPTGEVIGAINVPAGV